MISPQNEDDARKLQLWELYRQGMYHLSMGNFAAGWRLFDERIKLYPQSLQDCLTQTPDDPAAFTGKRVTIIADPDWKPIINGIPQPDYRIMMGGFEIMFFQYLKKVLLHKPKSILLICDKRLVTLFQRSLTEIEIIARSDDGEKITASVPTNSEIVICLASLGMSCIKAARDVPFSDTPWLMADLQKTNHFIHYLDKRRDGKIPLAFGCWSAGIAGKSIPPEDFLLPFAHLADRFAFVNVQGFPPNDEERPRQLTEAFQKIFGENRYIETTLDLWNDIDGTAALLQATKNLGGLAVMIPNYTEMVVCGIGTPHYKPLHADRHFWYGAGRVWNEDIFIYPGTQTFLQDTPGDWNGPLTQIAAALESFIPGTAANPIRHDPLRFKPVSVEELD